MFIISMKCVLRHSKIASCHPVLLHASSNILFETLYGVSNLHMWCMESLVMIHVFHPLTWRLDGV